MKKKFIAKYTDMGCGFPVIIEDAPLIKVQDSWTLKINYQAYEKAVLHSLSSMDGRLTGNQVRFIRLHFEKTLNEFARRLKVSHPAVLKWESRGDKVTDMSWTTEKDIRLFISKSLSESPKEFSKLYEILEEMKAEKPVKITLGAEGLAA